MINRNKIAEKKYSFKSFILVGLLDIYKVSVFLAYLKYDFKNTNKFENLKLKSTNSLINTLLNMNQRLKTIFKSSLHCHVYWGTHYKPEIAGKC